MSDIVFYYASHSRRSLALAYQSILSLRRYNSAQRLRLFTDATALPSAQRHFQFENLQISASPVSTASHFERGWRGLEAVLADGAERALYVDTETIFYGDVAGLFDLAGDAVIAARPYSITNPTVVNSMAYVNLLDHLHARDQGRPMPIFHPALTVMNRAGMQIIRDGLEAITALREEGIERLQFLEFPDWSIITAIAFSCYLGRIPPFSYQMLPVTAVPAFYEISNTLAPDPGILLYYGMNDISLKTPNPYADAEGSLPAVEPALAELP